MRLLKFATLAFQPALGIAFALACSALPFAAGDDASAAPSQQKAHQDVANFAFDPHSAPLDRFGPPPDAVLEYIQQLDEREYASHALTSEERARVQAAIETLPPLLRRVLQERVLGLYFIEDFASSGLAEFVPDPDGRFGPPGRIYAFLTFHPNSLHTSIGALMTARERTTFAPDDSGLSVQIRMTPPDANSQTSGGKTDGDANAFEYILAHELTHAADYSLRVAPFVEPGSREIQSRQRQLHQILNTKAIIQPYWKSYRKPRAPYDFEGRDRLTFYGFGGPPTIPVGTAPEIYKRLSQTPFASLYGSRIWAEDLAELASLHHLAVVRGMDYVMEVRDARGKPVYSYRPFRENDLLRERMQALAPFYSPEL